MNRPNLFIVGAPKCGTTAWHHYLGQHADIGFCKAKEPHYFCHDFPNFRWAKSEASYLDLFAKLPPTRYIGEASVMYLYSEVAIRNIFEFNPQAKLIAFIGDYDRFFVSYHSQIFLSLDEEIADPHTAWLRQTDRLNGDSIPNNCREPKFLQYRDVCRFGHQLQRVFDTFPQEQVKVVRFENWIRDPRATYLSLLNFLGLPDDGFDDFRPINTKRQNRSRWLGRLVRRPPAALLAAAKVIRKIVGWKRLGLANRLREFNEKEKQQHWALPDDFRRRIKNELADDKQLLKQLLPELANQDDDQGDKPAKSFQVKPTMRMGAPIWDA